MLAASLWCYVFYLVLDPAAGWVPSLAGWFLFLHPLSPLLCLCTYRVASVATEGLSLTMTSCVRLLRSAEGVSFGLRVERDEGGSGIAGSLFVFRHSCAL